MYADPHGIAVWNPHHCTAVEVRLVTAGEFSALTGEDAPPTPIDAGTYTSRGFPWFEIYDDAAADLAPTPEMERVRSVDQLSGDAPADPSIDIPESQVTTLGRHKKHRERGPDST